jgi:stage II sporulation protein AA (anti-sigma F factor antagonist)
VPKEEKMAKNFRVSSQRGNDRSLCLKLYGDFDATSACELIDILKESLQTCHRVSIDTDGLRSVAPFGLDVFVPKVSRLGNPLADILLTGRFKEDFCD